MEKVKITQEQVKLIEDQRNKMEDYKIVKTFAEMVGESSNRIHIDELIRALYVGYEVEPEFEQGDWIVINGETVRIIISSRSGYMLDGGYGEKANHIIREFARHATAEEIATEKQRRWWARHDRDVWELRKGDVLESQKNGKLVTVLNESNSLGGCLRGLGHIRISDLKSSFKVVCFAEDRKDIN